MEPARSVFPSFGGRSPVVIYDLIKLILPEFQGSFQWTT